MKKHDNIRDSRFELIRIIAIFFITLGHLILKDGFELTDSVKDGFTSSNVILLGIYSIVVIGVNLFFLLSGYFEIHFKMDKLLMLVFDIYFYYIILSVIGSALQKNEFSIGSCLIAVEKYWFMIVYLLIYILSSFLNCLIENATRQQLTKFVFLYIVIIGIYSSFRDIDCLGFNNGYSLLNGICLYIVGAFLRKYGIEIMNKKRSLVWIVLYVFSLLLNIVFISYWLVVKPDNVFSLFGYDSIIAIIQSILLFYFISRIRIQSKCINHIICFVARSVLATYLIQSCGQWIYPLRAGLLMYSIRRDMSFGVQLLFLIANAFIIIVISLLVDVLKKMTIDNIAYKLIKEKCYKFLGEGYK